MRHFPLYICLAFLFSCKNQDDFKIYDFDNYTMSIPENWKKADIKGIDSNVYVIITSRGDSIFSDFGKFSSSFKDVEIVYSPQQILKYNSMGMNAKILKSSASPEIDQAQGTFLKEYYYYDTISRHLAKIKIPKKSGQGETGIHFSDINKNKLTIVAKNLSEDEQHILVKSFKSIVFK